MVHARLGHLSSAIVVLYERTGKALASTECIHASSPCTVHRSS